MAETSESRNPRSRPWGTMREDTSGRGGDFEQTARIGIRKREPRRTLCANGRAFCYPCDEKRPAWLPPTSIDGPEDGKYEQVDPEPHDDVRVSEFRPFPVYVIKHTSKTYQTPDVLFLSAFSTAHRERYAL